MPPLGGGPGQIQKIINSLAKLRDTTIVIAQHMVDGFMDSFANRFQNIKHLSINVVKDNQAFENNNIYICEGETQLANENFTKKETSLNSYNPNINILFNSFNSRVKDTKFLCVIRSL